MNAAFCGARPPQSCHTRAGLPTFRGRSSGRLAFTIRAVNIPFLGRLRPPVRLAIGALLMGLAACATAPPPGANKPATAPAVAAAASGAGGAAVAPVVEPAVPAPAPVAVTSMSQQDVQRSMTAALEALQGGQEDVAELELRRILQQDPNHRPALSLMRQIKDDPVTLLGRESFVYKVQPGETLSRIAQRFMNDLQLFYALARYNGIKVPRSLAGGQTIRVPGRAPPPGSANTPSTTGAVATTPIPATTAVAAGEGRVPTAVSTPPEVTAEAVAMRAARQKSDTIAKLTRQARTAFAKQDLDAAIKAWDGVLELDPENRTAVLERQKTLGLKEKLVKVK